MRGAGAGLHPMVSARRRRRREGCDRRGCAPLLRDPDAGGAGLAAAALPRDAPHSGDVEGGAPGGERERSIPGVERRRSRLAGGGMSELDNRTIIGHVHLKVSDLDRAERFYTEVLGFTVKARYGTDAVFVAAGDYHHHIGLNTWQSKGGSP